MIINAIIMTRISPVKYSCILLVKHNLRAAKDSISRSKKQNKRALNRFNLTGFTASTELYYPDMLLP
jgi:hypothetical protein